MICAMSVDTRVFVSGSVYAIDTRQEPSRYACRLTRPGDAGLVVGAVDHQTVLVRFEPITNTGPSWVAPVHISWIQART